MTTKIFTVDVVYGMTRDVPLNYVTRDRVDGAFVEALSRDIHVIVHGSSKQGKTSLRKHNLSEEEYITVQCQGSWSLEDLHTALLKAAEFEVTKSRAITLRGTAKIQATAKAVILGGSAEGTVEAARQTTTTPLELDAKDANDIIRALKTVGFSRYVVVEDFHYLPLETQREFAIVLKAYHELSKIKFIIVGVWLDKNRFILFNGDLTGRVHSIDADAWSLDELAEVIAGGERLLNIVFFDSFRVQLLEKARGSVYLVQEGCREACQREGFFKTGGSLRIVGEHVSVDDILEDIVKKDGARYRGFLQNFAYGFQETELQMYRWLLKVVLSYEPESLEKGLTFREIKKQLQFMHPRGTALNTGNITQALISTAALQNKFQIRPLVLDYDQTYSKLNVVDRGFLVWLKYEDREALKAELDASGT